MPGFIVRILTERSNVDELTKWYNEAQDALIVESSDATLDTIVSRIKRGSIQISKTRKMDFSTTVSTYRVSLEKSTDSARVSRSGCRERQIYGH